MILAELPYREVVPSRGRGSAPFFTTKAVGVGMGLCRARQIIALHGGDLRIESSEGTGTKAFVRIPLASGCFPASSF